MAVLRMRAVSVISTMNVLWPRASSSLAPTRAKIRSAMPMIACAAGTKLPIWAMSVKQRDLPNVRALAGHVGTGDQQDHTALWIGHRIVGNECPLRFENVQHRVAAVHDVQGRLVDQHRTAVAVPRREIGQTRQHIEMGKRRGGDLQAPSGRMYRLTQCDEQLVLQCLGLLVGRQHLLFVLLQLRRDIAFRVLECLLANVAVRHVLLLRGGDFDVVAKDLVIAHLQFGNAGPRDFPSLVLGHPLFSAGRQFAKVVQFGVIAGADDPTFLDSQRAFVDQGRGDLVAQILTRIQLRFQLPQQAAGAR